MTSSYPAFKTGVTSASHAHANQSRQLKNAAEQRRAAHPLQPNSSHTLGQQDEQTHDTHIAKSGARAASL